MARKTYRLTDETFKVMSGHEAAIAGELECDVSYISKVKSGAEPDRYAPFREVFRATCHTEAPAEIWLNDLTAIYTRARVGHLSSCELSAKLLEKIESDARSLSTLVESLKDGHIDESECHEILAKLLSNQKTNEQIQTIILARLGELTAGRKDKGIVTNFRGSR